MMRRNKQRNKPWKIFIKSLSQKNNTKVEHLINSKRQQCKHVLSILLSDCVARVNHVYFYFSCDSRVVKCSKHVLDIILMHYCRLRTPLERKCPAQDLTQWFTWSSNKDARKRMSQMISNLSYCPFNDISFLRKSPERMTVKMGRVENVMDARDFDTDWNLFPVLFRCPVCNYLHPNEFLRLTATERQQIKYPLESFPLLGGCAVLAATLTCRYSRALQECEKKCTNWEKCLLTNDYHHFVSIQRLDKQKGSNVFAFDRWLEDRRRLKCCH